ncbi:MAG: hypothetical protein JXR25_13485 [Pontiellaceae bacterium]|nr:hypothetical protein [Pontiellaceae bacterium]MBN2785828.1 hypothetical protein [Pontiellaceae bacterium]
MRNTKSIRVVIYLLSMCASQATWAGIDTIKEQFVNPPDSARPHTWWHWMNGNVTKEGITADIEAMAEVGVGGAQIFNVADMSSCNVPEGPCNYMSDEWLEMVRHAVVEADRAGIEICMHNCAGWSSSGGPWITPEFAMKKVTYSEQTVTGGHAVSLVLTQPHAERGYYQDIAVVAFPTPADAAYRLNNSGAKTGSSIQYGVDLDTKAAPADAVIDSAHVVNLSGKMSRDGTLKWNCPTGNWTVLRMGYTITGKDNHPATGTGLGLECDKLSRAAMDVHWKKGIQPILNKLGDLAGPVMNNLLIDSYEVGINSWTRGFEAEFASRRGYDLTQYLPSLTGRVVDSTEISERFLWDYRRTISDLFTENYYNYFAEKCHEAGLLCSTEPYDGPFECMTIASQADILMGEFWVGGGMNHSVRIAASVAHIYGRKIVGAESFTSGPEQGRWQNHPRSMKALGDDIWCNGVNRYIFHRYAHQPWVNQWPGMTMGQWGTHFERSNTWWKDGSEWMKYIARSQYLLQSGRFHADVLYFGGEFVPQGAIYHPELKEKGYDYDAVGTDLIGALRVQDGKIVLPSGMSYSLLVMPNTSTMSVPVARKIRELIQDGATVLADRPQRSPSLMGYPERDAELAEIATAVWGESIDGSVDRKIGKGRILSGCSAEEALKKIALKPDFKVLTDGWRMNFIHRVIDGADVYFVSNQENEAGIVKCAFRTSGRSPELWSSQSGRIAPAMFWRSMGEQTEVTLTLEPEESVFVVFNNEMNRAADSFVAIERQGAPVINLGDEQVSLEIIKAEYGVVSLAQNQMVEVTGKLEQMVSDDQLHVTAGNHLEGDPANGTRKAMLVEFEYGGEWNSVRVMEDDRLDLPLPNAPAGKTLKILKAVYGVLPDQLTKLPDLKFVDVTDQVRAAVQNNMIRERVTNALAGGDPVPNVPKQMRVVYRENGVEKEMVVRENAILALPAGIWKASPWPAEVLSNNGRTSLLAWDAGTYRLQRADGREAVVHAEAVAPIAIKGPWRVQFETPLKAPRPMVMKTLQSLSEFKDPDVAAFSGTIVYQKQLQVTDEMLANANRIVMDLGRVEVMARVLVNGQDLGVVWKNPYRLDITDALKAGENQLEIRVTNLWVNRIIGDEVYPEDCIWSGSALAEWPQWLVKNEDRPTARQTFYTWKHWRKGDPLLPSGLIGPVYVRVGHEYPVEQ